MKNKIKTTKETRKQPASGYPEKHPNQQFPVNSGKKIKSTRK